MRRTFVLLALLAAGSSGGNGSAELLTADDPYEITGEDARGISTLVRSVRHALSCVAPDGSGATPRPLARRGDPSAAGCRLDPRALARHAAFDDRVARHRRYATAFALARAGVHSFHTATPPPFPLI